MLQSLIKFLHSRGLNDASELDNTPNSDGSPTELETFKKFERILSKEEMTLDDLKLFLQGQISLIENRWKSFETTAAQKSELIPYHTVYKVIEQSIGAPMAERQSLETYLNQISS